MHVLDGLRVSRMLAGLSEDQLAKALLRGLVYEHDGCLFPSISGAAPCTAGFAYGVDGNTIATSDPGNATPFDIVTVPAGGSATYSSTHAHTGSVSAKLVGGTGNQGTKLIWSTAFGTQTDYFGRAYVYYTANPASEQNIMRGMSGASVGTRVRITTGGLVRIDYGTTQGAVTSTAIGLNQFTRLEWHTTHSTTVGAMELKLFNSPESTEATQTINYSNQNNLANSDSQEFFNAAVGESVWWAAIEVGTAFYPGPILVPGPARAIQQALQRAAVR